MSVTQAMEWLIEHVDDPSVDAPIPGQDSSGAAGATASAIPGPSASGSNLLRSLSSQSSTEHECSRQDELTEIFKRIRRKREFRPDSRVGDFILSELSFSSWIITYFKKTHLGACTCQVELLLPLYKLLLWKLDLACEGLSK